MLCALGLAVASAAGADDWTPLRDEDGVEVFERARADSALPELRGRVTIEAPLAAVLAVIVDVPGQTRWLYTCIESRVVRQQDATTSLVYNRTNAPWPVADRDVLLETTIDAAANAPAEVRFQSVSDAAAPPVDGVVRMPRLVGAFALTALAPARTQVVYQIDIDPGGSLPGWLAQRTTRELPFETLRGLRRLVVGSPP